MRDLVGDPAGGRIIAAGWFKNINGPSRQAYLASISTGTGATLPWANHPTSPILDITRSGNRLYAAMAGPGGAALAYDISTGSRLWYYMTDGNVQAVTTVGGWPIFGMHGDYVAPKVNSKLSEYGSSKRISRHKMFELSPDGTLQSWAPALETSQGCSACGRSTDRRHAGGRRRLHQGQPRLTPAVRALPQLTRGSRRRPPAGGRRRPRFG